jgi:hypothetical protein
MTELASPSDLQKRGIYNFETLEQSLGEEVHFVMEDLLVERSVNLLAGDSGIGKTPLCVTIALCIAAGIPFLGMKVPRPRRVLYCDSESSRHAFHSLVLTLSKYLRLKEVPPNFHVWSPNWDASQSGIDYSSALFDKCQWNGFQPEVVFIDPLRVFFPEADLKRDVTMTNLKKMRRTAGGLITWVIVHHTRKPSNKQEERPPAIEDNPHTWFHEVAGQHAIINHVDTRLGVEATPQREGSEMTLGGFVRMHGPITPVFLARSYNDEGEPQGYMRASSLDLLIPDYRDAFHRLPGGGEMFTFKLASDTLGKSDSSANNMLLRLKAIGAVKKVQGGYVKVFD